MKAGRWEVLVDFLTSPGGTNEPLRVFLARDLEATGSVFDREDEEATMEYALGSPFLRPLDMVLEGRPAQPVCRDRHPCGACGSRSQLGGLRPADAPWMR